MGKSKKAPEYATTSYNTGGLFGSSTTNESGTTFTPADWQKNTMSVIGSNLPATLNNMLSNDYLNDPNFQAYRNNFNRQMAQSYDSNVLGQLANKGLMRSSGLQASTNSFNNTMSNNLTNLMDSYYNRQANNLSNLLNTSNNIYNYITGINSGSQNNSNAISNYNMQKYQADLNNNNNALWASLANTVANLGGTLGGAAIMASDINVKKNVKKIGVKNGFNWYEFEYKDGYGLPKGKHQGVIAQEVEKIKPDAVININGIKHVDYSKILGAV